MPLSEAILKSIKDNTARTVIDLDNLGLTDDDISSLVAVACKNTTYTKIILSNNKITDLGAKMLVTGINVSQLDLSNNKITNGHAAYLSENTSIERIDLTGNPLVTVSVQHPLNPLLPAQSLNNAQLTKLKQKNFGSTATYSPKLFSESSSNGPSDKNKIPFSPTSTRYN